MTSSRGDVPGNFSPYAFAAHPADPNTVFGVCADPDEILGGVIKSVDGALNWARIATVNAPAVPCWDVIVFGSGPTLLAAGNDGLHRSTNGGATWEPVIGLPSLSDRIMKLYRSQTGAFLYAAVEKTQAGEGGIFRSTDGGTTWFELTGNDGKANQRKDCLWIAADPTDDKRLYLGAHGNSAANGGVWHAPDATVSPDSVAWEKVYGGGVAGTPQNKEITWDTRPTIDGSGRLYACTMTTSKEAIAQANGLYIKVGSTWTQYATRDDGFGSYNYRVLYLDPFDASEVWLVTLETGTYKARWSQD